MGTILIACPSCSCHAFARELVCPSCGASLRAVDGSIQRTAGAVLLGLSLVVTSTACSSGVESSTSGGGHGGEGQSSVSGMGGYQAISAYGVGPSGGPSTSSPTSGPTSGPTSSSTGGEGGAGGAGGAGGK